LLIDDERSIARYSRYVTHHVRVEKLRDEQETVKSILDIGRRLNLRDWVLYPTRDETVAAFPLTRDFANFSGCRRRLGTSQNGDGQAEKRITGGQAWHRTPKTWFHDAR